MISAITLFRINKASSRKRVIPSFLIGGTMAKSDITKEIETQLLEWLHEEKYEQAVTECTLGYSKQHGIVDALSYTGKSVSRGRGKPRTRRVTWKCYEIKVSKSDFYSKSKWTFIGHYNYFVMPKGLYEQVKEDIPSHVGVLEYQGLKRIVWKVDRNDKKYYKTVPKFVSKKRATKQKLKMDEKELMHDYIISATRDVRKWTKHKNK